jgi:ABC-type polysaccharide/polyol phosphate transport system ATPase subunit
VAGVYDPDEGSVEVKGTVGALLSSTAGLVGQLSGWENILLCSVLQGSSIEQAKEQREGIARFSGLDEWIHAPVRTYSSGMKARLGFSIVASVEPDVLLLDEVMTVGDQDFKKRSGERIRDLLERGSAVLITSHNLTTLPEVCDHLVRLEKGRVVDSGEPGPVIEAYIADHGGKIPELRRRRSKRHGATFDE